MDRKPEHIPDGISSQLEPGEAVEAVFGMAGDLEIYATGQRFFGSKKGQSVDIKYTEVTEVARRASYWKTWRGIIRIVIGVGFVAAGFLTGYDTAPAAMISFGLLLIGSAFIVLGIVRRDDWVELNIQRREPPPSFWYVVVFLPFWLMLQSRKRYRVPGEQDEVDAFFEFLKEKLPPNREFKVKK